MSVYTKDYYRVLQVHPQAEPEIIRAAYKRLAQKYHPDLNNGGGALMQEINEAYDVLSDANRRAAYDRWYRVQQPASVTPDASPAPAPLPPIDWVRLLTPVLLSLLMLALLALDLLRLGIRGLPDITLFLIALGWVIYHFGGFRQRLG